jgi:hypothetical protein
MIRKLDLFLSNHSRFPVKQILMTATCSLKKKKGTKRQIAMWDKVEEILLSE